MSEYKKLFKNTVAMLIGNFASKILIFLMLPLYTSVLTTKEYGLSDLIFTTTNLLFPLFTCLATEYVMRFALDKEQDKSRVFSSAILITIIGFLILLCGYPFLKNLIKIGNLWGLFYLYYISTTLSNIISQFVKGLEKIKIYSASGVLNTFLVVLFNLIFLLYFKLGITGYILAYVIGAVITTLYLWMSANLKSYCRMLKKSEWKYVEEYIRFSFPMIPNSISWWVNNSLDQYILTIFWGVSATGIYAAGYKIPSFLTIISSIFLSAWQISAVKDFGTEETRVFFSDIYKKYSSLVIIFGCLIITLSKFIASVLLSNEFFEAWRFAPVLVFAFVFQTMAGFLGTIYTASKKTSMLFLSTMVGALVNAGLNLLLIPHYASLGASIATAFSYVVVWIIRFIHSRKKIIRIDINLTKDCVSYFLLVCVVWLTIENSIYSFGFSGIIFVVLLIMNRDCIVMIRNLMFKVLRRS